MRTGDYVRAIDNQPTRELSVWEGMRALRGTPGSTVKLTIIRGNAADPHELQLTREAFSPSDVTGRIATPGVGYIRIAAIGPKTAEQVKKEVGDLTKSGATKLVRRRAAHRRRIARRWARDRAAVRRRRARSRCAKRRARNGRRSPPARGDGAVTAPAALLVDTGTSGAAELFAAALSGNQRADLIGERTIGRAAVQKLIKLPDGSGLWLSTTRYLTPGGAPLHEKGLDPTVVVDEPDVEFGQPAPTTDVALDKAIARLAQKAAA